MIGFLRWLIGWIEFDIKGNYNFFLTEVKKNVWMVKKQEGILSARCFLKDYKYILKIAKNKQCVLNVLREVGFPYIIKKYRFRLGLAVGLSIFVFIMIVSNFFVWDVEVHGNVMISDEKIFRACDRFGLHSGSIISNVDEKEIEFALKNEFPEISWISINRMASKYDIEISELRPKSEIVDDEQPCNIVAAFDGEILSIEPYNGFTQVKAGDVVKRDDLLVSGIKEIEDKEEILFAHADAKVVAKVDRNNEIIRPKYAIRKQKTGEQQIKKKFLFFGLKLPLDFNKIDEKGSECQNYSEPIEIFSIRLPIFIQTTVYDIYEEVKIENDLQQLKRLLMYDQKNWETNELKNSKIVGRTYDYEETEDAIALKANCVVEQRIDEKRPITLENK
ncbi:MAG: sporulation protein YqfD [Oscillospiraceae bacterium]|nr:sporulation protein YqfD [Oscillospiraceae bacterium]